MSQRQNVPLHYAPSCRHNVPTDALSFVPLSKFESPYLGQSLHISRAYLGCILGNFWPYLRHIYKKPLSNWHFLGKKLSNIYPRYAQDMRKLCPRYGDSNLQSGTKCRRGKCISWDIMSPGRCEMR